MPLRSISFAYHFFFAILNDGLSIDISFLLFAGIYLTFLLTWNHGCIRVGNEIEIITTVIWTETLIVVSMHLTAFKSGVRKKSIVHIARIKTISCYWSIGKNRSIHFLRFSVSFFSIFFSGSVFYHIFSYVQSPSFIGEKTRFVVFPAITYCVWL